ncbi:30S ribosome-binding factor RbfA [Chitinispirillales bacterium ANBcel5]|uniref:30S ribosome-binding factor RbfA n=1 Tax=Cellulosispirillum alkaliphilum TaxID=3039283 RepID=UPI002A55ADEC|nr:30S ribosome-binding factor RbfA [Chitinispirillales bacterium ANBcel5]
MAAPNFHNQRIKEVLHREIGTVIAHNLRDPRIPQIVTITDIKLAQDNRNATVLVSIMDEEVDRSEAVAALNKAAPFIQRTVASRVTMKNFPKLYFKIDTSIEHSQHINMLLKEIQDDLE